MERKVIQIDEFRAKYKRAKRLEACYCDAVRAADDLLAREVVDLRRRDQRAAVLRLESLGAGVPANAEGWDLVYSATLLAGLPAVAARQVVKAIMARLKPGGRVLLSNVSADVRLGECSSCKTSGRVRRIESEMIELAGVIAPEVVGGQLVYRDCAGLNVHVEIYKSAGRAEAPRRRKPAPRLECVVRTAV